MKRHWLLLGCLLLPPSPTFAVNPCNEDFHQIVQGIINFRGQHGFHSPSPLISLMEVKASQYLQINSQTPCLEDCLNNTTAKVIMDTDPAFFTYLTNRTTAPQVQSYNPPANSQLPQPNESTHNYNLTYKRNYENGDRVEKYGNLAIKGMAILGALSIYNNSMNP